MKTICVFTGARSEYGLLKWIMKAIEKSNEFELKLIVSGAHLMESQGYTVDEILNDGFKPDAMISIDSNQALSNEEDIAEYMGKLGSECAKVLGKIQPDFLMVLGDRYELLPVCNSAFIMGIPIIHFSGGDVTEGALDNGIRNAITMLATYHFPGVKESADNIARMRGSENNIWAVGEPGLDAFYKNELMTRDELAENLSIDSSKKWILMTYHPETLKTVEENLNTLSAILNSMDKRDDIIVVATYANADRGGSEINKVLEKHAALMPEKYKILPSLGQRRYLSFMKEAALVIGNSSSGIVEAPCIGVPVVNIGDRQKGRHLCSNVISTNSCEADMDSAVGNALSGIVDKSDLYYWGDGKTSERVLGIFERELNA